MNPQTIAGRIVTDMPAQIERKRALFLAQAITDGASAADARIRADEQVRRFYQRGLKKLPLNMQSLAYRVAAKSIRGLTHDAI